MVASTISRVSIVDDTENARSLLVDELQGRFTTIPCPGPYATMDELINNVLVNSDAAIFDHHLVANYAPDRGAAGVANLYERRFPAVLRTAWSRPSQYEIRLYRKQIPVLLTPDDIDPESFEKGWAVCTQEFAGQFLPSREPWRTLIRIESVELPNFVDVVVPAWNHREVVRLPMELLALETHELLYEGKRFHAKVNLGAESQDDLYFTDFEIA